MDEPRLIVIREPADPNAPPPPGPLVVFVARGAPAPTISSLGQQKYWLEPAMKEVQEAFERMYGRVGTRPYHCCPLIHKYSTPLDPTSDSFRSMTDMLNWGRGLGSDIILVLAHWDSITTHGPTFANIFKDFKDVKVTIRVFGVVSATSMRRFYEFDAHRVSDHFQGLIKLENEPVIDESLCFVNKLKDIYEVRLSVENSIGMMARMTGQPEAELSENVLWAL
ncbi:hypothetical protein N7457_000984 [Penicillium paradoxum]|uniref:uncharacterized protein n=1 Tax=Penicillium paradoxum TaxID=176176 RepID=UPI00254682C1|nr:uncharacterized protein N7457_000984 [Penicillium paradoxum]KAJ5794385.1 hypothetical protein N7457_000984 [Penicillium paradoxum]